MKTAESPALLQCEHPYPQSAHLLTPDLTQPQERQYSAGKHQQVLSLQSLWWCKSGDCKAPMHQIKFQTPFICGEPTSAYELPELLEVEVLPP